VGARVCVCVRIWCICARKRDVEYALSCQCACPGRPRINLSLSLSRARARALLLFYYCKLLSRAFVACDTVARTMCTCHVADIVARTCHDACAGRQLELSNPRNPNIWIKLSKLPRRDCGRTCVHAINTSCSKNKEPPRSDRFRTAGDPAADGEARRLDPRAPRRGRGPSPAIALSACCTRVHQSRHPAVAQPVSHTAPAVPALPAGRSESGHGCSARSKPHGDKRPRCRVNAACASLVLDDFAQGVARKRRRVLQPRLHPHPPAHAPPRHARQSGLGHFDATSPPRGSRGAPWARAITRTQYHSMSAHARGRVRAGRAGCRTCAFHHAAFALCSFRRTCGKEEGEEGEEEDEQEEE